MEEQVLLNTNRPKKKNPIDRTNIISELFFCWLIPYFKKGYQKELTEDDMYQHRKKHDAKTLGDRMETAWHHQKTVNNENPSLIKALLTVFVKEIAILNIIAVCAESIRLLQPLMISKLLTFYDADPDRNVNRNEVYQYAIIIVLSALVNVFCVHHYLLHIMQVGMKMRVTLSSLIYRKALKLNTSALAETTIGQMVNLLSNDVGRFDQATHLMHQLWISPPKVFIVMFLCYNTIGYTGLIGIGILLVSMPIQSWLGKKISQFRLSTATRTDERVRLMNEIISGIQVIKMYTWEQPFAKLVETVREREMKYIGMASVIRAILMSCALVLNRMAIFMCILVYILIGNVINSAYTFTMISFYGLLDNVVMFFPQAVSQVSEMLVSVKRVEHFLLFEEIDGQNKVDNNNDNVESSIADVKKISSSRHVGIHLNRVSVRWLKTAHENTLENVSMNVESGELAAVVGSVGSGKSTLLHVILKELELEGGAAEIIGRVSYASQEPWLFGGSIRQNILFGQKYDRKKYEEVLKVCALERDLILFPHGDRTLAGERGVTLSGGQRARINLARAVYKEADIYLLDDPLSAVDTHVGKQLFEDCIRGYLRKKCVVLITHQLQFLKYVNNIYLLDKGKLIVSGSYDDIKKSGNELREMLANIEVEEEEIRRKSRMIVMEKEEDDKNEVQVLEREETGKGKISWHVYKSYVRAGGSGFKAFFVILGFIVTQALEYSAEYFVTFWVNIQQWVSQNNAKILSTEANEILSKNLTSSASLISLHSNNDAAGSTSQSFHDDPFKDWWLTSIFIGNETIIYYSVLITLIISITFLRSLAFYKWCLMASTNMHNAMFNNIIYSPMRFFNHNPSGRILNRFSKDIGTLDESLPLTLLDTIQIGLCVLSISLVIGTLSIWIIVPTVAIFILFYYMRLVFLETSRDIKRVESVTRSPIFTHLAASLKGLTTIRAFKAEDILRNEFDNYQNLNSSAYFMFLATNRALGFWMDFICIFYIIVVMISLFFVKGETFGGNIGLALTQSIGLTGMLQWGMRQWSELENQMTSVERIQEYAELVPEDVEGVDVLPKLWPPNGNIEFRNMSLRYSCRDPWVLRNLTFTIRANEKVGIVGRTGAGKSSLIQALFHLAEIDGSILIDGIDTKTIPLHRLRSKIAIIPQEPVLFSGTLRKNLDPFDEYDDEILWNALDEVQLKSIVVDDDIHELHSGLDSKMSEGGSNFSVGQRQLVCLARAIIRRNKILVLDEATANVDPQTNALVQNTIRKKFADCTVLTIAHRLDTIMDSDKVLVMDAGRVAEFDHPHLLLSQQNKQHQGVFYSLVEQTGKATARNLMLMAEESFNKSRRQY